MSLAQIEHELLQHPWTTDAHYGRYPQCQRIAVWAALNVNGIAALRGKGHVVVADTLKRHLAAMQDTIALSRYWRFTNNLPRNVQARIAAADFRTAFTVTQTSLVWPKASPDGETNIKALIGRVPLDLVYFGGHFATLPLAPGAVGLQWVRSLIALQSWGRQHVIRIKNLKHQQFVRSHDEVSIELRCDEGKNKPSFKINNGEHSCVSKRTVFEAV